jgi:hypothetical protein
MKFFSLLALSFLSLPVFAQSTCYVDMVDRYNRVVATYTGFGSASSCQEGMKQCRKAIRLSPQLGGVDCIQEATYPAPRPQPYPQPYPQPQQPRPQPYPQPYPQGASVDVVQLIQDLTASEYSSDSLYKMQVAAITQVNSPALSPFLRVCDAGYSAYEKTQCLKNGIQRAPREIISEQRAIYLVSGTCVKSSSLYNETNCFKSAFKAGRFQSLNYIAKSCEQMYNSDSSSRCYRQVFGIH